MSVSGLPEGDLGIDEAFDLITVGPAGVQTSAAFILAWYREGWQTVSNRRLRLISKPLSGQRLRTAGVPSPAIPPFPLRESDPLLDAAYLRRAALAIWDRGISKI
jgi:hypothetical protein